MNRELFKNLPSEIVIDILSRLPVRSIIRCKCVQKSWLHFIETQEFVKSHLSKSVRGLAICEIEDTSNLYQVFEFGPDVEKHPYQLVTEFNLTGHGWIMGSVDGLLFLCQPGSATICNPITREYINLRCPQEFFSHHHVAVWGFGSSKMTRQYKVVKIFHDECHVYTLGTRLWRRHTSCASLKYSNQDAGVFANGILHWLVYDINRCLRISCFDLETEHFSTLTAPHLHGFRYSLSPDALNLFVWRDCLGLCDNTSDDELVIWLMKEYGDEKSWTKELIIPVVGELNYIMPYLPAYPIKLFNNGDILIVWKGLSLAYYTSKTNTTEEVDIRADYCHHIISTLTMEEIDRIIANGRHNISATLHTPSFLSLKSFALENVDSDAPAHKIIKMNTEWFKNLPSAVVIDILSRLPVRSVINCKCVQKSWLHLIGTQEFTKSHLSKSVPGLAICEIYDPSNSYKFFEFEDEPDVENHDLHYYDLHYHDLHYELLTKFDLPSGHGRIMGSADGLLFLEQPGALSICNPITREYINLHCPQEFSSNHDVVVWGFGSSKMTGQYKVVKILHDECHVYTLGTRLWRKHTSCVLLEYRNQAAGVFANGNLHWWAHDIKRCLKISCFDLETEHFSTLCPPPPLHWNGDPLSFDALSLFVWGDCLGLCDNTSFDDTVIWLMKEYGVEKSWTKEFVIPSLFELDGEPYISAYPIKVFNDGDMLIEWRGLGLFHYSSESDTLHEVDMFKASSCCQDISAMLYTPSFLSLRSFANENASSF